MPLEVNGVPLEFDVIINVEDADTAATSVQKTMEKVTGVIGKEAEKQEAAISQVVKGFEKMQNFGGDAADIIKQANETASKAWKSQSDSVASLGTQFDRSAQDLKDYLSVVDEFNNKKINVPTNQAAPGAVKKSSGKPVVELDPSLTAALNEAHSIYSTLDDDTRAFVSELVELEMQAAKVKQSQDALNKAYEKGGLSQKQFIKDAEALTAQQKAVNDSIKLVTQRQKEYERSLDGVKEKSIKASEQLERLRDQMVKNPNSPLFDQWRAEAVDLEKSINNVNRELKLASSNTAAVDAMVIGVRGLVGGFSAAAGAASLFSDENEEVQQSINRALAAMSALNGIQELSTVLAKEGQLNTYLLSLARKQDAASAVVQTEASIALTAAQGSQATAAGAAATAQRGLNIAMFANPAAALFIGITALASAYLLLRNRVSEVKKADDLLKEAQDKVSGSFAEQKAAILPYLELLQKEKLSNEDRLKIYDQLIQKDPKLVEGIDAKSLSYERLSVNVDKYLNNLRTQIGLEANNDAIQASLKQEQLIQKKIEAAEKRKATAEANARKAKDDESKGLFQFSATEASVDVKSYTDELQKQQAETKKLALSGEDLLKQRLESEKGALRSVEAIDKEIARQKQLQAAQSTTAEQYQDHQKKIDALEEERKRIVGVSKEETRALTKAENELNSILDKRKKTLEDIASLERDAKQSGLLTESSIVDKINEKYDNQLQKLKDLNVEIERYNSRHPKAKQSLLGEQEIARIEAARNTEITNTRYKQDADQYIQSLKERQTAFEDFENLQKEGNDRITDKAREVYKTQLGDYKSYVQLLQAESVGLFKKILTGTANVGDLKRFQDIGKLYGEVSRKQQQQANQESIENYRALLQATASFNDQKSVIDTKYNKLAETLERERTKMTSEEYSQRLNALKEFRHQEYDNLQDTINRSTALYKNLTKDVTFLGTTQIKSLIKSLADSLQNDPNLSPVIREQIEQQIKTLIDLINRTDDTTKKSLEIADGLQQVGNGLSGLGSALETINKELGETVSTIGGLAVNVGQAIKGFQDFKAAKEVAKTTGDITGLISSISSIASASLAVVGAAVNIFNRNKQSQIDAARAVLDFQTKIYLGELDINALLRERERSQVRLNKLRIEGIDAENDLLQRQKDQAAKDYQRVFEDLQKESFVSGTKAKKPSLLLRYGIFGQTKVEQELSSLAGKSFEQLEQLFAKGQLTDRAKELFQQLQKLKQEGIDIDQQLKDLKKESQELFTGTTADNITDSITEGLKQGKRSAEDFAGTLQGLLQQALINGLKFKTIEPQMRKFYEQFAEFAESDGVLTDTERQQLTNLFNDSIENFRKQFEELQKISGINFNDSVTGGNDQNTLKGGFKTMTEDTANLLAGQFGGMRLTMADISENIAKEIALLTAVERNTGIAASKLTELVSRFDSYESGAKSLNVTI